MPEALAILLEAGQRSTEPAGVQLVNPKVRSFECDLKNWDGHESMASTIYATTI